MAGDPEAPTTIANAEGERATSVGGAARSVALVLALAAGFALVPRATRGCGRAAVDEDAPPFRARLVANAENVGARARIDGATSVATESDPATLDLGELRGRPVVLDFWATWCGPCQAESPIVNAIAQRYKDRGLAVVGVNTSDDDGLAARFVRKKGLAFPIVYDAENRIAKAYGVSSLPTLVVVSKTGKIVAVRHGVTSDSELDELVRRSL